MEKGNIGEICIAGIGLAVGYVNRPDLTEKAFIPDFLGLPDNPSGRIYRTGDLGRITGDGEIEYLGRLDAQVKIRGYRIELAEIESVIMRVPGIAQAVVGTFQPEPGMVELVAYYTLRQDVDRLDRETIVETIRGDLPAYMLPAFFERMDALPMLPCDKVDRKSLPPPAGPRHSVRKAQYIAPENDTEREIAHTLMSLLKLEQVSMDDHFFNDLGANSLLMARFCAQIRERLELFRRVHAGGLPAPDATGFRVVSRHAGAQEITRRPHRAGPCGQRLWSIACAAACKLIFYVLYSTAMTLALVQGYTWVSETHAIGDVYLRSLAFASAMFLTLTALPIAMKWLLIGRWREERIPDLEPRLFPVLARQADDPGESDGHVHRLAALQRVSQAAGSEDRPERRHLLQRRSRLPGSAVHRRRNDHQKRQQSGRIPGALRVHRNRNDHDRQGRLHRRGDGSGHRNQHRRWRSTGPLIVAAPGAGHSRRQAVSRLTRAGDDRQLPHGRAQAVRRRPQGGVLRRSTGRPSG